MTNWYALHVRSQCESLVSLQLEDAGIEAFFPHRIEPSKNGKRETIQRFMPGYVFGRFDILAKTPVVAITQVVSILGWGRHAVSIPDSEIQSVKLMVDAPVIVSACPFGACGELVRVKYGPLAGATGIIVALPKNKFRLVVSIEMMGRSISSEVDAESCELITPLLKAA